MVGGPGTGKSTVALEVVIDRLRAGTHQDAILALVPTRQQADRLRDELALRSGATFAEPVVRTYSAYAFDLIRLAREQGLIRADGRPPRLLAGADQDAFIAELLRGHREHGGGPAWPDSLGQAVGTRGFRQELRQFLDRVSEWGLEADDVEGLGRRCGVPEWGACAQFLREYRRVGQLAHSEAFDPAELVGLALKVLRAFPDFAAVQTGGLELLVVDDLQEATGSQHALVRFLADPARGRRDAVLLASPDTVVQGFRGARPDLVRLLPGELGGDNGPAAVVELTQNFRLSAPLSTAIRRVMLRIPSATGELGRRWEPRPEEGAAAGQAAGTAAGQAAGPATGPAGAGASAAEPPVDVRVVESVVHRDRLVSRHVLEAHLSRGVAYEDIAVIVRNGAQVRSVSRALGLDGISTEVPPVEIPLREEAAVLPLLALLERALVPAAPRVRDPREALADAAAVQSLLTGPYGRASSLDVRWLRQELLIHERAARGPEAEGPAPSSTQLLAALLDGGYTASELRALGTTALPGVRLLDMLAAARQHLEGEHTPSTAVWALWDTARAAEPWREQALGEHGLRGDRAHRDLDAVMALFQAAERYVDQHPGASVPDFLDHVRGQELPMDSLARTGSTSGRVKVLTPAAAAGLEWDTVIVTGLEEGLWPSTGLRGQLLRSDELATVAELGPQALRDSTVAQKLRAVRDDELRQFVTALSRARTQLHLIGISGDDATPSSFLELVRSDHAEPLVITAVPRPRTLTTLTALLRRTLEAGADEAAADAAGVLALLSLAEPPVPGADPARWWGLAPLSSADPIVAPGAAVRVSPSKVESVLNSPLNWFIQAAGGVAPVDFARSLGTLIHSIAEQYPEASQEQLLVALHHRWDELEMPQNWLGSTERERAERMLGRLAGYYESASAAGRSLVGLEQGIGVDLEPRSPGEHPVRINGSIDRVEADAEGRPYVVDLKTGKLIPTAVEAQQHPQLATYQAAILAGALLAPQETLPDDVGVGDNVGAGDRAGLTGLGDPTHPAGAALVAVGTETAKATVRAQAPIEAEENWAADMVADAAELMSRADFVAMHEQGGAAVRCTLPGACPLCAEGRQVTEP